ncbi:MAG: hypothetical protein PHV56_01715 [Clostridia bacterium]|nr:hypothetical protein [Clostridia bacterium]
MIFYDYLEQPKNMEQLYGVVQEEGMTWNEGQIELYLMLNPDYLRQEDGRWVRKPNDRRNQILQLIDKAMAGKRAVSVSKSIMPEIPLNLITTPAEVITIAIESGRYESPKEEVLRYKK